MDPILKKRNSLIARLAREICDSVHREHGHYLDQDNIELTIGCWLPLTYTEAKAVYDETKSEALKPTKKPSIMNELRAVLGFGKEVDLIGVIKSAIERINDAKAFECAVIQELTRMAMDAKKASDTYEEVICELKKLTAHRNVASSSPPLPTEPSSPESPAE